MKRCSECGQEKELNAFRKKGAGHTARCKDCLNGEARGAYGRDPERRRQVMEAVARYKEKTAAFLVKLKSDPCTDCGEMYPHYVMDFDHCRGEKVINLGDAVRLCWSQEKILEEVAKCDLVCANCHRIRTNTR